MISCKEYHAIRMADIKEKISRMEYKPSLLIVQVGDNEASNRYVRNKVKDCKSVGAVAKVAKLYEGCGIQELQAYIEGHSLFYDGVILQLPLPAHIEEQAAKKLIPPELDVDGFNSDMTPCTPRGIMDWLHFNFVSLDGKNVTIIGRSELVGKPLAELMLKENATVTVCHSHTIDISEHIENADIIVSAVGKVDFITGEEMFNCLYDPIVIDVGINFDENDNLCGDCEEHLDSYGHASYITPVPGGVGLLTRVAMLDNLLKLCGEE